MYPELEFIFAEFEEKFKIEITALTTPNIETEIEPITLHQSIKNIYWHQYQQDKERKREKANSTKIIPIEKVNSFVLEMAMETIKLPNTGNLQEAEFVVWDWKITDGNNTNAKVVGIGKKKGKYQY